MTTEEIEAKIKSLEITLAEVSAGVIQVNAGVIQVCQNQIRNAPVLYGLMLSQEEAFCKAMDIVKDCLPSEEARRTIDSILIPAVARRDQLLAMLDQFKSGSVPPRDNPPPG